MASGSPATCINQRSQRCLSGHLHEQKKHLLGKAEQRPLHLAQRLQWLRAPQG